jgi:cellulose synthase/poly-beta-1,6-N-acetylglucosamine synthase-like glycosyltransferase
MDVEVSEEVPGIPPQLETPVARCAWLLVRVNTETIGSLILEVPPQGLTGNQISKAILSKFDREISYRTSVENEADISLPPFLASRDRVLMHAPKMSVIVCTRERPERLEMCLQSLLTQNYPNFSVLVIDNNPQTDRTKTVVDRLSSKTLEYVVEPRKGLSRAKNTALELVGDGIVASIDDDEIAEPDWLAELARGFYNHPEADAIAGVMVPAELETWAQVWFEQYGGHNKLRGFTPAVFSPSTAQTQSPLYPLPPFGSGGNVAFHTRSLARIGGFDVALGPGTPSMSSEDTRVFTDLLRVGGTVVYQPTAVTRHFHRRTTEELRLQMFAYGTGLTAFYTSLVLSHPQCVPELIRLLPKMYRDLFTSESLRSSDLPDDFPSEMRRAKRRGMAVGPVSYLHGRLAAAGIVRPTTLRM